MRSQVGHLYQLLTTIQDVCQRLEERELIDDECEELARCAILALESVGLTPEEVVSLWMRLKQARPLENDG